MIVGEDVFQEGHAYQVSIYLTPKNYYSFAKSVYVVVNDDHINTYDIWDSGQLRVTYTFPTLNSYIRTVDIEITPPEAGDYPDYYPYLINAVGCESASYNTDTYWNDVCWTDMNTNTSLIVGEDTFEEGHAYKVVIYLTPKQGYQFAETVDVTLNGDTVQTYSGYGNQLRVAYAFPKIPYTPGWQKDDDGWWYRRADGSFPWNRWEKIDGKWYHFDNSGVKQTGWQKISGVWYYFKDSGMVQSAWLQTDGKWYHFDDSGALQIGWRKIGTKWYYFKASGEMAVGWQKINLKWYYFKVSGEMAAGWQKIGNEWFYFNADGAMRTGWLKYNGSWYFFNAAGTTQTGWKTIDSKTYYFKAGGAMAESEWVDGYWLNADGTWTYPYRATWREDAKGRWYGDTSGWYAKNCTIIIDGKSYTFDAQGYVL
jgi:glucan-binding YG repeat protein